MKKRDSVEYTSVEPPPQAPAARRPPTRHGCGSARMRAKRARKAHPRAAKAERRMTETARLMNGGGQAELGERGIRQPAKAALLTAAVFRAGL